MGRSTPVKYELIMTTAAGGGGSGGWDVETLLESDAAPDDILELAPLRTCCTLLATVTRRLAPRPWYLAAALHQQSER